MPELPADWRHQMVEMIRGAEPLHDTWFTGGPVLSPLAQIGVYRRQFTLRIYEALIEDIPGLHNLLGDAAEDVLRPFIRDCPPSSWTLNRIADPLPAWLEAQGAPRVQIEMAQLDLAIQAGFDAAWGTPIDPAQLAQMPPLKLQPHVRLLRLTHNVHWIRSRATTSDDTPPELEIGDFPVVVFRRGIKMRHWELPLGSWAILEGIDRGLGVEGAIERAFEKGWLDPENLAANIQEWFGDYAERNLLEIATAPRV